MSKIGRRIIEAAILLVCVIAALYSIAELGPEIFR